MLGLCFHSDNLSTWGRLDAKRYNKAPEDVQQNILDVVAGVNGAKVCRDLCALSNDKQKMNNYVHRYARRVNKSCANVKAGYELAMVTQDEVNTQSGLTHTVMEYTLGYFEDRFDDVINDDALDELMHEFAWVRKHIMYETNSDLAVIMMNVADNENAACAKMALCRLCEEYELKDFFATLLSCEGAYERIVQMLHS